MALPKYREALTRVPVRLRSKVSTLIKEVSPLQGARDFVCAGTCRETSVMATNKRALTQGFH